MAAKKKQYLNIVYFADDIDLRTVTAQSTYLRRTARMFDLQPYECLCYTNRARTRFRLILKTDGGPGAVFLCIPEIDQKSKYSVYLRISETLASLTGVSSIQLKLDELQEYTEERIVRSKLYRKARARKARNASTAQKKGGKKKGRKKGGRISVDISVSKR